MQSRTPFFRVKGSNVLLADKTYLIGDAKNYHEKEIEYFTVQQMKEIAYDCKGDLYFAPSSRPAQTVHLYSVGEIFEGQNYVLFSMSWEYRTMEDFVAVLQHYWPERLHRFEHVYDTEKHKRKIKLIEVEEELNEDE